MDYIEVGKAIYETSKNLEKGAKTLLPKAQKFVEAERQYRIALAKEIIMLKSEGMQVTLIPDVARGNVADLKFERDLAEEEYKVHKDALRTLEAELSGLQTIYKRLENM